MGGGWHALAPAGGRDQPGPHLGAPPVAGQAAAGRRPSLGVPVAGAGAGGGRELGAAAGCAATRTDRRSPTQVAIRQLAQARAGQASDTPRPVVGLDSAYDVGQLAQAHLDADLVVRLAKNRVFRRAPGPYSGRGRPHTHGSVFKLKDARTHGRPDRSASLEHPAYGTVSVDAWTNLHVQDAADAPFAVLRVQAEHLPRHGQPTPLWLAWIGG